MAGGDRSSSGSGAAGAQRAGPRRLRLADASPVRVAALLVAALVLLRFFDPVARVLLLAYAAAILAVTLNLIVRRLPLGRKASTAVVGVAIVGLLGTALWLGGELLVAQLRDLIGNLPAIQQRVTEWLADAGESLGLDLRAALLTLGERAADGAGSGPFLGGARSVLEAVGFALVVLFGALFALARPGDGLLTPLLMVVPERSQPRARRVLELLAERLVDWVQGQLLAMCAVGALATIAFYIIGVPYALLLGVINGLLEFIPLIGPWLGGVPAVIVAAVDDPMKGVWTAAAVTAIQQIESAIVTPLAMANRANLHPFVTLFALLLFGSLFGFLGILLAVPLVLLVWTVAQVYWVERDRGTPEDAIEPIVTD